jgi:L-2,4-diaminobutyric acid acetyltransferase
VTHPSHPSMRAPRASDAAQIWTSIPAISDLERNSAYAYLLLCTHFAQTSIVAEDDGELHGFVLAYRPPTLPTSLFVWQVGVVPAARGRGLAGRLLQAALDQPACAGVDSLCATVSPDNKPSLALFHGFARRRGVACEVLPCFGADLFPEPHPDENLLRIGPLSGSES